MAEGPDDPCAYCHREPVIVMGIDGRGICNSCSYLHCTTCHAHLGNCLHLQPAEKGFYIYDYKDAVTMKEYVVIKKTMVIEERLEQLNQTQFELRQKNDNLTPDDRMTLVITGDSIPRWRPGQILSVTVSDGE